MTTQPVWVPHLQIRSRSAICYALNMNPQQYRRHDIQQHKTYSGKVTDSAAKRIRRTCEIMLMRSPEKTVWNTVSNKPTKFRLTFVTVTISEQRLIDHREAYEKGLKRLLRVLREKWGWTDYIWKAELQKRGQIHWHITGNQFMDWRVLKSTWNNIQYSNGWLESYHARTGKYEANSTDIHAVQNVAKLDLYLAKYISKDGGKITGKTWDCSNSLAGKKFFAFEIDPETGAQLDNATETGRARKIVLEQCSIYETAVPQQFIPNSQREAFDLWLGRR